MRRRVETRFRESGKTAAAPLAARGSRFVGPFALPLNGWLVAAADGISLAGVPWESERREGFRFHSNARMSLSHLGDTFHMEMK